MKKYTVTTIVLLLGLFTYVSAQNRSARETLEGLRDFQVVVEYGQVEGLDASMQPTILQVLQERARDQLTEAELPLLPATDAGDTVHSPRLVFIVTVNKNTDTAPAILVESKVYERGHLWRDSAKEMELATWVQHGVGAPRVTHELLFQVFDGQVKQFIKAYREVNPKPIHVERRTADPPSQLSVNSNGLEGLKGTNLFVAFRPDVRADANRRAQLQKALQKEAESRLVKAGIPLLNTAEEHERAGQSLLYLLITLSPPISYAPAIEVQGALWQQVRPVRDPQKQIYAVTWESRTRDDGPIADDAVLEILNNQLEEFIKAYKAANSKLATISKSK